MRHAFRWPAQSPYTRLCQQLGTSFLWKPMVSRCLNKKFTAIMMIRWVRSLTNSHIPFKDEHSYHANSLL